MTNKSVHKPQTGGGERATLLHLDLDPDLYHLSRRILSAPRILSTSIYRSCSNPLPSNRQTVESVSLRALPAFNPSAYSALSSDPRSVGSSSGQSTPSTSGSRLRRLFDYKRSHTTPDTSPEINSDSSLPGTSSRSNSSLRPGGPPAKHPSSRRSMTMPMKPPSPSPRRTRTTPTELPPRRTRATRQPAQLAALAIDLSESRNWEPVSPAVLRSMETATSDSNSLLRPATDGTVSVGNLEGLVSRAITNIEDPSMNDHFRATFLTIYQLFATSERLFDILKRRFESSERDPIAARSRYP